MRGSTSLVRKNTKTDYLLFKLATLNKIQQINVEFKHAHIECTFSKLIFDSHESV